MVALNSKAVGVTFLDRLAISVTSRLLLVSYLFAPAATIETEVLTGHYVENTGNTTLTYLEIFKSGRYRLNYHVTELADLQPIYWVYRCLPRRFSEPMARLNTT